MKKIESKNLKGLKMFHVFFVVVLFGGILISLVINLHIDFTNYDETYYGYKNMILLSSKVIRHGTIATIIIGCIYGFFTNWGFFKHKWIGMKLILFAIQICLGVFIINNLSIDNLELLESQKELALSNDVFIHNQFIRQIALFLQVFVTIIIFVISFIKPGMKKER